MSMISSALSATRRMRLTVAFAAVAAVLSAGNARAEYPERPITIVACFPPGGGTDLAVRMINTPYTEAPGTRVREAHPNVCVPRLG